MSRWILHDPTSDFLWSLWLVLPMSNNSFIIHRCHRPYFFFFFLFMMINDLLNSVIRVLLSYGGSHWFKSNSRYILLDTRVKGMVSNKFFYSSSFIDFISFHPTLFLKKKKKNYWNWFVVALEFNYTWFHLILSNWHNHQNKLLTKSY